MSNDAKPIKAISADGEEIRVDSEIQLTTDGWEELSARPGKPRPDEGRIQIDTPYTVERIVAVTGQENHVLLKELPKIKGPGESKTTVSQTQPIFPGSCFKVLN